MTAPLVPAEVSLREFEYMPLKISKLFGSEFHARSNDGQWRAGLTLWLKSWHQEPAGSLPTDDVSLARLAEFGRDLKGWAKVKEGALYGWTLCDDGRLYHKTVAEVVMEAWEKKCAQRDRTEKARLTRLSQRQSQPQSHRLSQVNGASVTDVVTASNRREGKKIPIQEGEVSRGDLDEMSQGARGRH